MSHGYVFVLLGYIGCDNPYNKGVVYTYRREAFALLVSIDRAMRRPLTVKRATSVGFTLFLCIFPLGAKGSSYQD